MSEAEQRDVGDVEEDLSEEEESNDSEEQPALEDDEMADLDAIAEDVAAAESENEESEDAEDDEKDEPESSEESLTDSTQSTDSTSDRSWGKMYTKGVVKLDEALIDEFGDESSAPITEADIRDLELDEAFDEWMATKTGRPEDIPPGQWVAIGTALLVGGNLLTETDVAKEALSDGI